MKRDPLNVVTVVYDGLSTFEFGIAVELFGVRRTNVDPWYRMRVASAEAGRLRATGGIAIDAPYTLKALDTAGTIVIPGWRSVYDPATGVRTVGNDAPPLLLRKLRRAYDDGARILSVCSGVFVLAAAGLLDGRRATTHWKYAAPLMERYPDITVDPDVLFIDEGQVITSAGSAAGIDMGLHLVRRDFGATIANEVARHMVVPPNRDGGQKQFVEAPMGIVEGDHQLAETLDRLRASLTAVHTVDTMARDANMSPRTFARRFGEVTGTTPHRWLQNERVRRVQELLENTQLSLSEIASQSGFGDVQTLRVHFRRVVGTSPTGYRKSFR